MATVTWTGASSSSFFNTTNWDPVFVPGTGDVVVVGSGITPNILSVQASATIAGLQVNGAMGISAGTLTVIGHTSVADNSLSITGTGEALFGSLDVNAGGELSVGVGTRLSASGHAYISEAMTVAGIGTLDASLNGTASFSTLQIEDGANLGNAGILEVDNTSDTVNSTGVLQNTGHLNLVAGALNGRIFNQGQVNVVGAFVSAEYLSDSTSTLSVQDLFETVERAQFEGDMTVTLDANPATSGRVFVSGIVSIGLQSLTIDAADAALSEGSSRTIFTSGVTAMDAFSVAAYSVLGQASDFAYALQLTGIGDAVGSLNLLALNDGATGGRAVLADSATSRDITLAINSDTGRGTIQGGSFADLHASLLHGVDEVRSGSGNDVLAVSGGTAGFTLIASFGDDSVTGGAGADLLSGGGGADTIRGGNGADTLRGGAGDDLFVATSIDSLFESSGGGTDTVRVNGSMTLTANLDHLILTGSAAINGTGNGLANALSGNSAANRLNGQGGADTLTGDDGNDTLTGGAGPDAFVFAAGNGVDRVLDFDATGTGSDDIDLRGHSRIVSFADLMANHLTASGGDIIVSAGPDAITLVNVQLADLTERDFIF